MLSMRMIASPAMDQRQSLEASLYQSLTVGLRAQVSLLVYQQRESFLTGLYRKALRSGKVRRYQKHGMSFEFALISKRDLPEGLGYHGLAFSQCLFSQFDAIFEGVRSALAKGSWLLFVVEDMFPDIPKRFLEYAAVHEHGEQITLGQHEVASKLEFAIAAKEKQLTVYIEWLERNYGAKFADVFTYEREAMLPDDPDFAEFVESTRQSPEHQAQLELIEEFQWPISILRRLKLYNDTNKDLAELIRLTWLKVDDQVRDGGATIVASVESVRAILEHSLRTIINGDAIKYMSPDRLQQFWENGLRTADRSFSEWLGRRQQVFASANKQLEYNDDVVAAGIESGGLPRAGVFSSDLMLALDSVR